MRKLLLAGLAAALLPSAANAEQAFGWIMNFDQGQLRLLDDDKIYIVPDEFEDEDLSPGRIAHLTYQNINGALVITELQVNGTGGGSSD
jgi:hypothetical protein